MIDSDGARRVILGGAEVDLWHQGAVVRAVHDRLKNERPAPPLAISSANLDHIHHFGCSGGSRREIAPDGRSPQWLVLLDGAPLIRRARTLTGRAWPRLAGSDLLPVLLAAAEKAGASVGFLGGRPEMHESLAVAMAERFPGVKIAGMWAPERHEFADPRAAAELADAVRDTGAQLLVVGLGKPRQERWIQHHADASGARVLLAFGAAADFLAGRVSRAPAWVRRAGLEWAFRLLREPRRLARRYCLEGPPALWRLHRHSGPTPEDATGAMP